MTANMLPINDTTVLITEETNQQYFNSPMVIYNDSDTFIQLTKSNMNNIYIINNSLDVRINLPLSITISDIGIWIIVHKIGSGNLSIYSVENKCIENSLINSCVCNNEPNQPWANISLFLAKFNLWKFNGAPLGTWTTV
jgi:hypothetical protein